MGWYDRKQQNIKTKLKFPRYYTIRKQSAIIYNANAVTDAFRAKNPTKNI